MNMASIPFVRCFQLVLTVFRLWHGCIRSDMLSYPGLCELLPQSEECEENFVWSEEGYLEECCSGWGDAFCENFLSAREIL